MRRVTAWIAGVTVLAVLVWADWSGWLLFEGSDVWRYDGRVFEVIRVIDGDTLEIAVSDGNADSTHVRLWGINAPEMAKDGEPAEPFAEESAEALTRWALGQKVRIQLETSRLRGRYGRLLAHVEVTRSDGKVSAVLNERLLAEGYALLDTRWSHRADERYRLLAESAKREKRGLWAD